MDVAAVQVDLEGRDSLASKMLLVVAVERETPDLSWVDLCDDVGVRLRPQCPTPHLVSDGRGLVVDGDRGRPTDAATTHVSTSNPRNALILAETA